MTNFNSEEKVAHLNIGIKPKNKEKSNDKDAKLFITAFFIIAVTLVGILIVLITLEMLNANSYIGTTLNNNAGAISPV